MVITGVVGALITGIIIGGVARLIVPGRSEIGCLLTILIGIAGAAIGSAIGVAIGAGSFVILVLDVVVAAAIVAVFSGFTRGRRW